MAPRQYGLLALSIGVVAVLIGGVMAHQRSEKEVPVDTPVVRVETNKATGEPTVDAPFAHVEKNANGTRVDAPGVNVEVPKRATD